MPTQLDPRRVRLAARLIRLRREAAQKVPADIPAWLRRRFPRLLRTFAPHHLRAWDWVFGVRRGERPRPYVLILARGGGKSSTAEAAVVTLGVTERRRYGIYVRATQEQANTSVGSIAGYFESKEIERLHPAHADRMLSKYGHSKGWRRNRLRTAGGFTVDALGLDVAVRGVKIEEQRPDLIVFDDIDTLHDSEDVTRKKIDVITKSILPAGTRDVAVLAIQNLIIPHGVFSRLAGKSQHSADFLQDRIVDGPIPALIDPTFETRPDPETGEPLTIITGGTPTWEGQGIAECQNDILSQGFSSFMAECQHQIDEREGALWTRAQLEACRVGEAPDLVRVVVGVDPSGGGDHVGIVVAGIDRARVVHVLADKTVAGRPAGAVTADAKAEAAKRWGRASVQAFADHAADRIVAEKNFGGDLVAMTIKVAAEAVDGVRHVPVKLVTASRGKAVRAEPVADLYAEGRVKHVGALPRLEREMTQWVPGDDWSPNRLDALVWAVTELAVIGGRVPDTSRKVW